MDSKFVDILNAAVKSRKVIHFVAASTDKAEEQSHALKIYSSHTYPRRNISEGITLHILSPVEGDVWTFFSFLPDSETQNWTEIGSPRFVLRGGRRYIQYKNGPTFNVDNLIPI